MTTKQVQLRRGSDDDHDSFTGAIGELTYVSDTKELRIHDGSLAGGFRVVPDAVINVKSYGAVGDDVADDTAAFNAAITQALATNNPILIPAGIYRVDNLDVIPNDIEQTLKIVGVGKRSSVIRHTGTGAFITLGDDDHDTGNANQDWGCFHFEGICVTSTAGAKGINFVWRFSSAMIRDSHFEGFSDGAIFGDTAMPKSWNSHVDNCTFAHNHSGILVKDHSWCISDGRFYANEYGIRTISGDGHAIGGEDDGRSAMNINGCNFGPSNVAGIALSGQSGCSIAGCYFECNYDDTFGGDENEAFQYNPDLSTVVGNAPCILIEGERAIHGICVSGCSFQGQDGVKSHIEIDAGDIDDGINISGLVFIGNCFGNTHDCGYDPDALPDPIECDNAADRYCIKITDDDDRVMGLVYTGNYISSTYVAGITNKESSFSVLERRVGGASTTIDNQNTTHTGEVFYRSRDDAVYGDTGTFTMWMSDGTGPFGTGDDGDIYIRSKNDAGLAWWFRFRHTPLEYTATLHTEERDLDSNSSTVAQLANVLGTLIKDLQNRGLVGTSE